MALGGTQWNFTHYTYTCSTGGLESDTLHLYLRGPEGCTQSSGILHRSTSDPSCFSLTGLEETEKKKNIYTILAAGIYDQQTFATLSRFFFLADHLCCYYVVLCVCILFRSLHRNSLGNTFICFCLSDATLLYVCYKCQRLNEVFLHTSFHVSSLRLQPVAS